ncbi:hypothetical protein [Cytobacillus gottheilii]|uniref:hypothetical protein n=1 Tax=Cytobacillus gottheilii TaxID=859144 RepID=UPI0009B98ACD|nr:hypothetical protein [Cytobacillus gottheilii]
MDKYFNAIVDGLNLQDIEVLNVLTSTRATSLLSAITRKEVNDKVSYSEAIFRKTLQRLEAIKFVNVVTGNKEHSIYATEFGQNAINLIAERNEV